MYQVLPIPTACKKTLQVADPVYALCGNASIGRTAMRLAGSPLGCLGSTGNITFFNAATQEEKELTSSAHRNVACYGLTIHHRRPLTTHRGYLALWNHQLQLNNGQPANQHDPPRTRNTVYTLWTSRQPLRIPLIRNSKITNRDGREKVAHTHRGLGEQQRMNRDAGSGLRKARESERKGTDQDRTGRW
ncbi:hypothetical protein K438DRAFT_1753472 [Mycena galopus ATCC 62051]|nr:hypothetical protein K438DRAFT_1753472 [Mycena galopus ATCC 62051]